MEPNLAEIEKERRCDFCGIPYSVQEQLELVEELAIDHPYNQVWFDFCLDCFESGRWSDAYGTYGKYEIKKVRRCKSKGCTSQYTILDSWLDSQNYFSPPYDYQSGCDDYCLHCWLVGEPPESDDDDEPESKHDDSTLPTSSTSEVVGLECDLRAYAKLCEGDVVGAYQTVFEQGLQIAILPLDRVQIGRMVPMPGMISFFPPGMVDLDSFNLLVNSSDSGLLSQTQAEASQVTRSVLERYPLVVLPCAIDIAAIWRYSHNSHMSMLRQLSETVETFALNYFRFRECRIHRMENLPCRPGQVASSNTMMSGVVFYDGRLGYGNIIGGAAFGSVVTRGLAMDVSEVEWDKLPGDGEVGNLARRALTLYAELLDSHSETSRFVQAMSLLEFLAYPDEFTKFQKVKMVIAEYFTSERTPERTRLETRFLELTHGLQYPDGDQKDDKGRPVLRLEPGVRTRIVHHGDRLDQVVPTVEAREDLFRELDAYIRPVIDHMIANSELSFEEYCKIRKGAFVHFPSESSDESDEAPF